MSEHQTVKFSHSCHQLLTSPNRGANRAHWVWSSPWLQLCRTNSPKTNTVCRCKHMYMYIYIYTWICPLIHSYVCTIIYNCVITIVFTREIYVVRIALKVVESPLIHTRWTLPICISSGWRGLQPQGHCKAQSLHHCRPGVLRQPGLNQKRDASTVASTPTPSLS